MSLIELMVAVVIGIFCSLVLTQLAIQSERSRRTTTSGADAQTVSHLVAYELAGELRQAGYGLSTSSTTAWGCAVAAGGYVGVGFTFAPLFIQPGAVSGPVAEPQRAPDQIFVGYSNHDRAPTASKLVSTLGAVVSVVSPYALAVNDYVLIAPPAGAPCDVRRVAAMDAFGAATLNAVSPAQVTDALIFGLGPNNAIVKRFAVQGDELRSLSMATGAADNIHARGVLGLLVQYGMDGANGGTVDGRIEDNEWLDPPAVIPVGWNWTRIRAVRFALLTRSGQFERPEGGVAVTSAVPKPSWPNSLSFRVGDLSDPTAATAAADSPDNWKNYRYRVLEATVALNNVIWRGTP